MKLFLAAFLLAGGCGAATAQAQVTFAVGPKVGYTLSTTQFAYDNQFKTSYRSGVEAGVVASLRIGHFALQPAALYAQKGYRLDFTIPEERGLTSALYFSGNTRLDYLAFPVNLGYSQHPDGQGWQMFAGPYLGLLLGGRYISSTAIDVSNTGINNPNTGAAYITTGKVKTEGAFDPNASNTTYSKRIDTGLQGGVGYQYRSFLLQATYSLGLRNIHYRDFAANVGLGTLDIPYRNRSFQASLTYLFSPKG
jgi:hypothetical protein